MSTDRSDRFAAILDHLYAASIEPSQWDEFCRQLAASLGAKSSVLRLMDNAADRCSFGASFNFDPEYLSLYRQHYIAIDPVLESLKDLPPNRIYLAEEQVDYRWLKTTEYYNHYVAPQYNYHLMGGLVGVQNRALFVAVQQAEKHPSFSREDKALFQRLVPHLQRTLLIWSRTGGLELQNALMSNVLDGLGLGVILLDPLGRVAYTNTYVASLLDKDRRLSVKKDRLRTETRAENMRLTRFLELAMAARSAGDHNYSDVMLIRGLADWEDPLYLMVAVQPVQAGQSVEMFGPAHLVLLVGPLSQQGRTREDVLRVLFGLTEAEAKIAVTLARGGALSAYCDERAVSKHTARTQLKSVFMKMDVNSQAQLVAKIARGPWFDPDG